jgi:exosortase B
VSATPPELARELGPHRGAVLPTAHADVVAFACLAVGFLALYLPTYWTLALRIWPNDEQGHGPFILLVSLWLITRSRHRLATMQPQPAARSGSALLALGLTLYVLGRSQSVLMLEVGSQTIVIAALLLMFLGLPALRELWFPLFFLFFMVPLPEPLVAAATLPLKSAVSAVAAELLHLLGYPIGRAGVILHVGAYQLLVADACAGLSSMFTLEALGLLYLRLMGHRSLGRNIVLSMLTVPIAFAANVVRVLVLVLVTYHLGDAAGQGFVHFLAGILLFVVGLLLVLAADRLLGRMSRDGLPAA